MPDKSEKVNNGTFLFLPAQSELFADTYSKQVSILHKLGLYDRLNNVWLISHIVSVQMMYRHTYLCRAIYIHTILLYKRTFHAPFATVAGYQSVLAAAAAAGTIIILYGRITCLSHVLFSCFVFQCLISFGASRKFLLHSRQRSQ